MVNNLSNIKTITIRADALAIHPTAQRRVVPANVKKITRHFDFDAIGAFHAVEYPINGVTKIWLVDGQHRHMALMHLGFGEWEVTVMIHTDVRNDARACALFDTLNRRSVVRVYDEFLVQFHAGEHEAVGVMAILDKHHIQFSSSAGDGKCNCPASLRRIWRHDKGMSLNKTLSLIETAWGTKLGSLEGKIIEGLGLVIVKYNQIIHDRILIKKLMKYPGGPSGLIGNARGLKDMKKTSIAKCVAELIINEYNKGRRTDLLPPL